MKLPALVLVFVSLAGLACNCLILGPGLAETVRGHNDFMGLYPGGKLAGGPGVYDPAQSLAVQRQGLDGYSNPHLLFCRPPYYAALMWPLARLPYYSAYILFQLLMLASTAAFVMLWPGVRWQTTVVACCWSLPLVCALAIGQDVALLLVVLAVALRWLNARRDFAAGLIFSLCAIKFHLFLLVPVWILARRMGRFAGGLATGGAVLALLSIAATGLGGFRGFWHTASSAMVNPGVEVMPNFYGMFNRNESLEAAGAVVVAALVWQAARRGSQAWALGATLSGGMLTSHHAYISDCALLLPAVLAMMSETGRTWQRYLALFFLAPLVYISMFAGPAILAIRLGLIVLCASFTVAPRDREIKLP